MATKEEKIEYKIAEYFTCFNKQSKYKIKTPGGVGPSIWG